jgi:hypothetical protein
MTDRWMNNSAFSDITPYSLFKVILCFGGIYRLNLRDRKMNQGVNLHDEDSMLSFLVNKIWTFCDCSILVQVLCVLTLSLSKTTVLFIFQNTTFRRLNSVSVFRWNLLSWAQSIEPVHIRFYLKAETESSLRNVVFWKTNRTIFFRWSQDDG